MACSCQDLYNSTSYSWENFKEVRKKCRPLNEIFVPEELFNEFEKEFLNPLDNASHRPHTFLAFERGHLFRMTSPIHHFVLEGNTPHHKLTTQYRNDLQETWFFKKKDEIERHQKARIFQGRLYELICAEWLEQQGWEISNLEALGGGSDIEGKNSNGLRSIVEVKYFGQHDDIFKAHLNLEITRL